MNSMMVGGTTKKPGRHHARNRRWREKLKVLKAEVKVSLVRVKELETQLEEEQKKESLLAEGEQKKESQTAESQVQLELEQQKSEELERQLGLEQQKSEELERQLGLEQQRSAELEIVYKGVKDLVPVFSQLQKWEELARQLGQEQPRSAELENVYEGIKDLVQVFSQLQDERRAQAPPGVRPLALDTTARCSAPTQHGLSSLDVQALPRG